MPIAVGQPAPDFTLKDQSQKEIKLSDFAGKRNVVLIFYPLDFSPICTNEHACFVNDMKQFEKLDAQGLRRKDGHQLPAACRLPPERRCGGQIRDVFIRKRHYRQSDRDHRQGRKDRLVQKLRYSRGAGHERSRAGASRCEIRLYFGEGNSRSTKERGRGGGSTPHDGAPRLFFLVIISLVFRRGRIGRSSILGELADVIYQLPTL